MPDNNQNGNPLDPNNPVVPNPDPNNPVVPPQNPDPDLPNRDYNTVLTEAQKQRNEIVKDIFERNKDLINIRRDDLFNLSADTLILLMYFTENYKEIITLDGMLDELKQAIDELAGTSIEIKNEMILEYEKYKAFLEANKEALLKIIEDIIKNNELKSEEYLTKFEQLYNSSVETYYRIMQDFIDLANKSFETIAKLTKDQIKLHESQLINTLHVCISTLKKWQQKAIVNIKRMLEDYRVRMDKAMFLHEKRLLDVRDSSIATIVRFYNNSYVSMNAFVNIYMDTLVAKVANMDKIVLDLSVKCGANLVITLESTKMLFKDDVSKLQRVMQKELQKYESKVTLKSSEIIKNINTLFTNTLNAMISSHDHLVSSIERSFNTAVQGIMARLASLEHNVEDIKIYQEKYGRDFINESFNTNGVFQPKQGIDTYFIFIRGGSGYDNSSTSGGITSFGAYKTVIGGAGNTNGRGSAGESLFFPITLKDKDPITITVGRGSLNGVCIITYAKAS